MTRIPPTPGWEMFCAHANEVPNVCPCPPTCGCRFYACQRRPEPAAEGPLWNPIWDVFHELWGLSVEARYETLHRKLQEIMDAGIAPTPVASPRDQDGFQEMIVFYQRGPTDPPGNSRVWVCPDCKRRRVDGHLRTCPWWRDYVPAPARDFDDAIHVHISDEYAARQGALTDALLCGDGYLHYRHQGNGRIGAERLAPDTVAIQSPAKR